MGNMDLYNALRSVPQEAQKNFSNGRFSGTDINPMWRIKKLTEVFGQAGDGWWVENVRFWTETAGGEMLSFCTLELCLKDKRHLFGIGGSKMLKQEKSGAYANDECYKMAYTDALSVACKSLGMGADVYWDKDRTKYETQDAPQDGFAPWHDPIDEIVTPSRGDIVKAICAEKNIPIDNVPLYTVAVCGVKTKVNQMTEEQFASLCKELKA